MIDKTKERREQRKNHNPLIFGAKEDPAG